MNREALRRGRGAPEPGAYLLRAGLTVGASVLVLLVVLPLVALCLRVPPSELFAKLGEPVVLDALRLSMVTTFIATGIVIALGLPVAWMLSGKTFRGKGFLEVLVQLPMVLPPTVAGLGLLLAFGRAGLLGAALGAFGLSLPFTTVAVVMAQVFMSAPLFITASVAGFRAVDSRFLDVAAAHRASPAYTFARVTLPLALPSVIAGAAMSWARALGEFGATITFAGALQGRTQTMPIAVYLALQSDLDAAIALAVVLLVVSFALLLAVRSVSSSWDRGALGGPNA